MQYCGRCLYPANHPLGITFDDDGVCSGCRVHEEKDNLDWSARRQALGALLARYRRKSPSNYDCVVPVSGARDSYFIVDVVKREFGMNPLLVSYNKHYTTRRGHRNLAYLRTLFDCDFYSMLLSADLIKRVTRRTLERRGSIYWHVLAGQSVLPVQVAVRHKIPLVVWGVHQGVDQVGMFSHLDEVEMTRRYRKDHDLMGLEAEDLVSNADGLPERDLRPFFYPHDKDIEQVGVRGIYLGNHIRWDSKAQHEVMIGKYGYESGQQQRTFDTYNDVDCVHYSGLHDLVKFLKLGYGKASDHACREIRLRRLSREDGLSLAERHEAVSPHDLDTFLRWINLDEPGFFAMIDRHRDGRAWQRKADGGWTRRSSPRAGAPANAAPVALDVIDDCRFELTASRDPDAREDEPMILHRGWVDGKAA